jgi:5-methyltetrahydropteroyltriglutamate--homocysteine methyltransferase
MTVAAQLIGYPRIGPNRELKWALERAWSGRSTADELAARLVELRRAHLDEQRAAIGVAIDDFFVYDAVLETALMLGLVPEALASDLATNPFGVLTALARGTPEREAWEMTKWFDTNYHFVVPEIDRSPERFSPLPWRQPATGGDVVWAVIGPYSLVKLSKLAPGLDPVAVARGLVAFHATDPAWLQDEITLPGALLESVGLQMPALAPQQALVIHAVAQ